MTGRIVRGLPKPIDLVRFSQNTKPLARRRRSPRALTAFLTGAALLALGALSLEAGIAAGLVNSSNSPMAFIVSQVHTRSPAADYRTETAQNIVWTTVEPAVKHRRNSVAVADAGRTIIAAPRQSVCVRLCDGYYFPIGSVSRADDLSSHESACSGLCPDAPTQLFVEPAGSDKIEDAVAPDGARYTALPVAFRNRTTFDNTCTCHRHIGETPSLRNDVTLRDGDSIMTPTGIVVFRGGGRAPFGPDNFTTLAKASMPRDKREILVAIERAALPALPPSGSTLAFVAAPTSTASRSRIAFAAPPDRSKATIANSIHFVEPTGSVSN
jgi:Protein of unknown function (DUF2865)